MAEPAGRPISKSEEGGKGPDFLIWLTDIQAAIGGERDAVVPCQSCVACCTSSQFVHIAPDETDTLEHVPAELLFPAPGLPRGHMVLGYDERGHCPMLVDHACSIYEHRPRTCRSFDCRIFGATGVEPGAAQWQIAEQARQWRFRLSTAEARVTRDAIAAAAEFLHRAGGISPQGLALGPTQRAALAVEIHHLFLRRVPPGGELVLVEPDPDTVRSEVRRRLGPGA